MTITEIIQNTLLPLSMNT